MPPATKEASGATAPAYQRVSPAGARGDGSGRWAPSVRSKRETTSSPMPTALSTVPARSVESWYTGSPLRWITGPVRSHERVTPSCEAVISRSPTRSVPVTRAAVGKTSTRSRSGSRCT